MKGSYNMVTMKWLLVIAIFFGFVWLVYSWGYSDGYEDAKVENIIDMQNVFRTK